MESIALVIPHPGQGMPVSALKGQKNGRALPTLSAETIPELCKKKMQRRRPAKTRASLLGIRHFSMLFLEELVELILLNSIDNDMKSKERQHKGEYGQVV